MIKPLQIGNVTLENNLILAPMAGVTDLPFRSICKEFEPGLVCTEMVSSKAIYYGDENWWKICDTLNDYPGVYEAKKDNAFQCNGVLSTSGVGDGFYAVCELLDWKDNRCGYTILFI